MFRNHSLLNVNRTDCHKWAPLHCAAKSGHVEIVKVLPALTRHELCVKLEDLGNVTNLLEAAYLGYSVMAFKYLVRLRLIPPPKSK